MPREQLDIMQRHFPACENWSVLFRAISRPRKKFNIYACRRDMKNEFLFKNLKERDRMIGRMRRLYSIKMDRKDTEYEGACRIYLAQERNHWQAVSHTVMNIWVLQNVKNVSAA
jgi:hypothetical protein